VGIRAIPRMEPVAAFINDSCEELERYFTKAEEAGVGRFMGDAYHHTVHAEEIVAMFYTLGIDFDRMWEATSEYQILGSYVMEHAMYHAKKHGIKAGTFNFHSVPYNDDVVCCMVGDLLESFNKYSMIHALKTLVEKRKLSFKEFDEKHYGYELHPGYRERFRRAWNMRELSWDNPDWMEGAYVKDYDEDGNLVWGFDPRRLGEGYRRIVRLFGFDGGDEG
jgi:hypothetical protein